MSSSANSCPAGWAVLTALERFLGLFCCDGHLWALPLTQPSSPCARSSHLPAGGTAKALSGKGRSVRRETLLFFVIHCYFFQGHYWLFVVSINFNEFYKHVQFEKNKMFSQPWKLDFPHCQNTTAVLNCSKEKSLKRHFWIFCYFTVKNTEIIWNIDSKLIVFTAVLTQWKSKTSKEHLYLWEDLT